MYHVQSMASEDALYLGLICFLECLNNVTNVASPLEPGSTSGTGQVVEKSPAESTTTATGPHGVS